MLHRKFLLTIVILFSCLSALAAQGAQEKRLGDVDRYLGSYLKETGVPGFSCVIVKDGRAIYQKGFGVEVVGTSKPMSAQSSSAIGSLTKSFTALSILQLADRGLLGLDDAVTKHIPWFRTADKTKSDKITIRLLLGNFSGMPSVDRWDERLSVDDEAIENGVRSLATVEMTREPGESFEYSNEGWNVLGLIASTVSKMPYREYLRKNILEPLGMSRSTTDPAILEKIGALKGHVTGVDRFYATERSLAMEAAPAGSILSCSAEDMGKYLIMILNGGVAEGKRIVSEANFREWFKPQINLPGLSKDMGGSGTDNYYAMGWMLADEDGYKIIHHGGNIGKMSSITMFSPDKKTGVCLLFNYGSILDPYRFTNGMTIAFNTLRLASGDAPSAFGIPVIKNPDLLEPFTAISQAAMDNLQGLYTAENGEKAEILYLNSKLSLRYDRSLGALFYGLDFMNAENGVGVGLSGTRKFQIAYSVDGSVRFISMAGMRMFPAKKNLPSGFARLELPFQGLSVVVPKVLKTEHSANGFYGAGDGIRLSLEWKSGKQGKPELYLDSGVKILVSTAILTESINTIVFTQTSFRTASGKRIVIVTCPWSTGFCIIRFEVPENRATELTRTLLMPFLESLADSKE